MSGMNVGESGGVDPYAGMTRNEAVLSNTLKKHPELQTEYNHVESGLNTLAAKISPGQGKHGDTEAAAKSHKNCHR
jgi:hypothetical protein